MPRDPVTHIKLPTLLTTHAYFTLGYAFLIPAHDTSKVNEVTQSLIHTLPHSLAPSLSHSHPHSVPHIHTLTLSHSLTHSVPHSLSLTHSVPHSLSPSLTQSLTLTLPHTHSLTPSLTHPAASLAPAQARPPPSLKSSDNYTASLHSCIAIRTNSNTPH